jgi:predicted nuclease with TOPRIM domain
MAKIEDIDFWFTEFKEEMINLLNNFSEEVTNRLQQIYVDVMKLNEKVDRTFDEIHKIHEETHQEILDTIYSLTQKRK